MLSVSLKLKSLTLAGVRACLLILNLTCLARLTECSKDKDDEDSGEVFHDDNDMMFVDSCRCRLSCSHDLLYCSVEAKSDRGEAKKRRHIMR